MWSYVCTCDGKTKLSKSLQDHRLILFLMGLNEIGQEKQNIKNENKNHILRNGEGNEKPVFYS